MGGQHPTQALLDLYTIYNECNALDGLSVALIGALDKGRTARSLAYLLGKFERVKLYFVAPQEMQIKQDILDYLDRKEIEYVMVSDPASVISRVDVVYQTRIDRERLQGKDVDLSAYKLDVNTLKQMRSSAIILHPLPRSVEISPVVDNDSRAAYFRQTRNGIAVRMALLTMLFE
jgi:aspartate carbamoyltransferase catalytic subunit